MKKSPQNTVQDEQTVPLDESKSHDSSVGTKESKKRDSKAGKGRSVRSSWRYKSLPVRRAFKQFWRRNRTPLTILIAVFIVIEGCVAWFYPSQWWKPALAVLTLAVVLISWRNMKSMVKFMVCFAIVIIMAALGVQSGYAYGGTDVAGVWGISVLTGWAVIVMLSYMIHPMMSRWSLSLVSAVVGFTVGYAFMMLGVIAISVSTITACIITFALFLGWEAWRRKFRASIKPSYSWGKESKWRVDKAMISLWPNMKHAQLKLIGSWETTVWFGDDDPTLVLIPLDLDEPLKNTKRYGLTYHHRNIRATALWLVDKVMRLVPGPAPVIMFVDVRGKNTDTKGTGEVIALQKIDSLSPVYVGIFDGSTSARKIRTAIAQLMKRFMGVERSNAKDMSKLTRDVLTPSMKHASRVQATGKKTGTKTGANTVSKGKPDKAIEPVKTHDTHVDWDDGDDSELYSKIYKAIDEMDAKKNKNS